MKKFRLGYLGKQMLAYAIVLTIFVLVLFYFAYSYVMDVSEKNAAINQDQLMVSTLNLVETYFDEIYSMAQQVSQDTKVIDVFKTLQDDYPLDPDNYFDTEVLEEVDMATALANHNALYMPVWRISAYNAYGDFISTGASYEPYSKVSENLQSFVSELDKNPLDYFIYGPEKDRWSDIYEDSYISLIMPITNYYGTETYGYVEIQESTEKLEEVLTLEVLTDMDTYLINEHGEQVFPVHGNTLQLSNDQLYITSQETNYGWTVYLAQNREQMLSPYRSFLYYLYAMGIVILAVLLIAIYLIARKLSKPIIALSRQVHNLNLGNMSTDLTSTKASDEVKELDHAITAMLNRLSNSLNYEKRAYLLALQSQMDPHFLYNSLSVISSMGIEAGSDKIVNFCKRLSSMLRYSSSYDIKPATIGDELDNVKNYMELMTLRFEDDFSFVINSDDLLNFVQLPRLILQPIVENCFEHAFRSVPPPWEIEICTKQVDTYWMITIADNGAGFDKEKLDLLDSLIKQYSNNLPANYNELKIGGLGLANTIIRLMLSANSDVSYEICPNKPRGTIVILKGALNDTGTNS